MKILIVHNHYLDQGGEDRVVVSEAGMLRQRGHEVILYERTNHELVGLSFIDKVRFLLFETPWSKKTYQDISRTIDRNKPDLVHIHNTFIAVSPSIYQACRDSKIPVVQTLHNYRFLCPSGVLYRNNRVCEECLEVGRKASVRNRCWKGSLLSAWLMKRIIDKMYREKIFQTMIDGYIVPSEFGRKKFISAGFHPRTIFVKPNFLDHDPGKTQNQGAYALFIGALRDYKGVQQLVKDWKEEKINFPLKIVGEGPLQSVLLGMISETEQIEFLGKRSYQDVIALLQNSRFLVVPSACYETFGRVIVEAYACGVPVLANRGGALQELVRENKTGLLYDASDSQDLANKAQFFINNDESVEKMKDNARMEYERYYTKEINYQLLISIYNKILNVNEHERFSKKF